MSSSLYSRGGRPFLRLAFDLYAQKHQPTVRADSGSSIIRAHSLAAWVGYCLDLLQPSADDEARHIVLKLLTSGHGGGQKKGKTVEATVFLGR